MMLASFGLERQIIHTSLYSTPLAARFFGDGSGEGSGSTKNILRLDSGIGLASGLGLDMIAFGTSGALKFTEPAVCESDKYGRLMGEGRWSNANWLCLFENGLSG